MPVPTTPAVVAPPTGSPVVPTGVQKPPGVPEGVPDVPSGWSNHWVGHGLDGHVLAEVTRVVLVGAGSRWCVVSGFWWW
ncbi:hypothetical protein [Nocardia arthritidis]|uniref:Uncharacterized protein n=1 Tax=Nocardia arthritidis TaxID=228602 RepID=A0A6G9YBW7_9NOCA|nr:hypothetical protein [Nocardia arthritidis]QIS10630.1 hypothetical protein F5544_13710 [Nocardia arthritidis]